MSHLKDTLDRIWNINKVANACHINRWEFVGRNYIHMYNKHGLWQYADTTFHLVVHKGRLSYPKSNRLGASAYSWYPKGFWMQYHERHMKQGPSNGQDKQS